MGTNDTATTGTSRRAAVLGSPIAHSRSPQLHLAAYRALGLDWSYERIECTGEQLPGLVSGLGPEWVGLSVTMPGKVAALEFADERTERAVLVGSANTLVRTASGWRADCTDVDGVRGALRGGGVEKVAAGVVVGAGGTARPALLALAELGAHTVTIVARDAGRAMSTLELAGRLGMSAAVIDFDADRLREVCADADALVSTVPANGVAAVADSIAAAPVVLDAIYDPWPTPLAEAVLRAGHTVISGLQMLLNQAYGQVEQFTGAQAPRAAMSAALDG
ncbi:shikimate dehydrogenase [Nocardia macrotermitis]|uniref:Shikimate dehydrogenase (NADP(+)) n=1 Tax=Nocardia macrotermitis TaxID=2585198 RepID=A0A7K0D836_9NOCA|nr:shikimate dehydrogenase [Nocardia macrotermitis]MQY21943.1 Shikimate dehydrogenase (NADP(+)) [Nocardia macrotermitis]